MEPPLQDRRVAVVLYGTPIMELEDALESSFGAAALDRRCFELKVLVRCSPLPVRRSFRGIVVRRSLSFS